MHARDKALPSALLRAWRPHRAGGLGSIRRRGGWQMTLPRQYSAAKRSRNPWRPLARCRCSSQQAQSGSAASETGVSRRREGVRGVVLTVPRAGVGGAGGLTAATAVADACARGAVATHALQPCALARLHLLRTPLCRSLGAAAADPSCRW